MAEEAPLQKMENKKGRENTGRELSQRTKLSGGKHIMKREKKEFEVVMKRLDIQGYESD